MKGFDIFGYSFSAIKLRKLRAALTTLGAIIGIAAIVVVVVVVVATTARRHAVEHHPKDTRMDLVQAIHRAFGQVATRAPGI